MTKIYQIQADISEDMPDYTFFIKAKDKTQAFTKASVIVWNDYAQHFYDIADCKRKINVMEIKDITDLITIN
jgi:hypothetical protein